MAAAGKGGAKQAVIKPEFHPKAPLPYVNLYGLETGVGKALAEEIERMGSWWTKIEQKLYSPVAKWVDPKLKNTPSFITEGSSTKHLEHLKSLAGYYVAVGGLKSNLPSKLANNRVGGNDGYHIVYLPNLSPAEHHSIIQRARKGPNTGNRRHFHSLIRLESGFTPFQAFEPSREYKSPLCELETEREVSAVNSMTPAAFHKNLQKLVSFKSRALGSPTQNDLQKWIKSQFASFGYHTCNQHVDVIGYQNANNILAIAPGTAEDFIVVGAHYDSRPYEGAAPGAEDNGSGSAALLSMAKAFKESGFKNKNTVVFAAFTGEELGLYGSTAFVEGISDRWGSECQALSKSGVSFLDVKKKGKVKASAVIIMDEIGWVSPNFKKHTVTLETRELSRAVMNHLAASSKLHNKDALQIRSSFNPFGSDHMPFLNSNQMAVLTINGDDEGYPNYHQHTDTIENVNSEFSIKIAKMNLGALFRLAESAE
uniref:Peptidase M28 domain-containing protein n=1 Tax=Amorphochlora amoebiformis TaxID=1561963 RepID=A0A7S0D253_9EUKA